MGGSDDLVSVVTWSARQECGGIANIVQWTYSPRSLGGTANNQYRAVLSIPRWIFDDDEVVVALSRVGSDDASHKPSPPPNQSAAS
ncbi:hypothetical protein IAQ61_003990 [Plenodomus lingam]|uniref:uncharacterized protein n=1 Tax=Leptosphaeria maculans TaxID=5022 RepID=UPI0033309DCA|nr:hypothetical protein IAQ61_003990 [Plenodomus lingam]